MKALNAERRCDNGSERRNREVMALNTKTGEVVMAFNAKLKIVMMALNAKTEKR